MEDQTSADFRVPSSRALGTSFPPVSGTEWRVASYPPALAGVDMCSDRLPTYNDGVPVSRRQPRVPVSSEVLNPYPFLYTSDLGNLLFLLLAVSVPPLSREEEWRSHDFSRFLMARDCNSSESRLPAYDVGASVFAPSVSRPCHVSSFSPSFFGSVSSLQVSETAVTLLGFSVFSSLWLELNV